MSKLSHRKVRWLTHGSKPSVSGARSINNWGCLLLRDQWRHCINRQYILSANLTDTTSLCLWERWRPLLLGGKLEPHRCSMSFGHILTHMERAGRAQRRGKWGVRVPSFGPQRPRSWPGFYSSSYGLWEVLRPLLLICLPSHHLLVLKLSLKSVKT